MRCGVVAASVEGREMSEVARRLYRQVFTQLGSDWLYRIWNFVPAINDETQGMEVYRQFSYGRSLAFEESFGTVFEQRMSAASAVGTRGHHLALMCLVGPAEPLHLENPLQVPAYHYPQKFGPRAPSFARATTVTVGEVDWLFISGTAAIRGAESLARGDVLGQLMITWENLRGVMTTAGWDWERPKAGECREFRVYLRRREDFPAIKQVLEGEYLRGDETVSYLQAEVCRAELDVEIEAHFHCPR